MPSIWEKFKAARAQLKTPEEQAKLRKQTDFFMDQTEGLMGGGMAGTIKNAGAKVAGAAVKSTAAAAARRMARRAGSNAGKSIVNAGKAAGKAVTSTAKEAASGAKNTVSAALKGAKSKFGSLKENAVALATGGLVGTSIFRGGNANQTPKPEAKPEEKPTTPAAASKTERMKTQSNAEANKHTETPKPVSRPNETPKPVSRSESKYPTYQKDSAEAKDFRSNFAKARKEQGKDGTFEWQGKKYNTKVKGE